MLKTFKDSILAKIFTFFFFECELLIFAYVLIEHVLIWPKSSIGPKSSYWTHKFLLGTPFDQSQKTIVFDHHTIYNDCFKKYILAGEPSKNKNAQ